MKPQIQSPEAQATTDSLRAWSECDLFCIAGYAGLKKRCGWRGRLHETSWNDVRGVRTCPRCGGATLLGLPRGESVDPTACSPS